MRTRSALVVLAAYLCTGCRFDTGFRSFGLLPLPNVPLADLTASDVDLVFEDEGTIAVHHGFGCAESNRRGEETLLRLRQQIAVPDYVNRATVFLNGWRVRYLSRDHEVGGLGVSLGAIQLRAGTLSWDAVGSLSDRNFDDGYSLCYYFTTIAWNSGQLAVAADHEDEENHEAIKRDQDNTTALAVIAGFLQDSSYPSGVNVALLPRGYGVAWRGRGSDLPDNNLFQLAYNLDYAERFVDSRQDYDTVGQPSLPSSASQVDVNVVTKETKTIFKDDTLRRDYYSGDSVSVLMGGDVGFVQPPFSILPREDIGFGRGCIGGDVTSRTDVTIENVPFTYAIPVLSGWDMRYGCNDAHVTEMGVWLDTFRYTRPVVTLGGGTLRYTFSHVLRDRDRHPGSLAEHRVHILGFKPVLTKGPIPVPVGGRSDTP